MHQKGQELRNGNPRERKLWGKGYVSVSVFISGLRLNSRPYEHMHSSSCQAALGKSESRGTDLGILKLSIWHRGN
jgi:hypothetical protein